MSSVEHQTTMIDVCIRVQMLQMFSQLQMISQELKFMKRIEKRSKITNYLANGTMSNSPNFMHCLNEGFYRINQHRT